jgi:hypothetical protein
MLLASISQDLIGFYRPTFDLDMCFFPDKTPLSSHEMPS